MILLYHLLFPDDTPQEMWNAGKVLRLHEFKRQMTWLKNNFDILSLSEYMRVKSDKSKERKRIIAVTFDDGYHNTYELISPFLEKESIPVTFFVNTSHLVDGQLLWFVYFNALCFEKSYQEIIIEEKTYPLVSENNCFNAWRTLINLARQSSDAITFYMDFAKRYPLPEDIIRKYSGFTEQQIAQIGRTPHLALGGHTHNHPYLDKISKEDQYSEMLQNKQILEKLSGNEVTHFAYTGGIYNRDSIAAVKMVGFQAAFSVNPKGLSLETQFEMPRTDIYSPSLIKLIVKTTGLVNLFRQREF